MADKSPTAIGYVRVSTEEQAAEGVSLEAQRAKVVAYCDLHGLRLAQTYADEGISGKRADNRPGLQEAIAHSCVSSGGVLVVYSLSRLALAYKRSKRQRVSGHIPYGFRLAADGVNLVDEPAEQRAVKLIQRLWAGGSTTREIEKELQRQGLRPRHSWHWHPKVVLDLCRRSQ